MLRRHGKLRPHPSHSSTIDLRAYFIETGRKKTHCHKENRILLTGPADDSTYFMLLVLFLATQQLTSLVVDSSADLACIRVSSDYTFAVYQIEGKKTGMFGTVFYTLGN